MGRQGKSDEEPVGSFPLRRAHVLGPQRQLLLEGSLVKGAEPVEGPEGAAFSSASWSCRSSLEGLFNEVCQGPSFRGNHGSTPETSLLLLDWKSLSEERVSTMNEGGGCRNSHHLL